jgi:hypothetical protein
MFADKIISFLTGLDYKRPLPNGISVLNPFRDNPEIIPVISQFYRKLYSDEKIRHLIVGINPGRFGSGVTGIPLIDTKRLAENCGLSIPGLDTFETSSVFIYEMIDASGGAREFYSRFYISTVSPLGFTSTGPKELDVNQIFLFSYQCGNRLNIYSNISHNGFRYDC